MMERKDFLAIADKTLADFISSPPQDTRHLSIRMTSGTTGGVPLVVMLENEPQLDVRRESGAPRRTVVCYGSPYLRLARTRFIRNAEPGASVLPLDPKDIGPSLRALLAEFSPTEFLGVASFIVRAAEHMQQKTRESVRSLMLIGELVTTPIKERLLDSFPNASIDSRYIAGEIGAVSRPNCQYLTLNCYHPAPGVLVEILNADEGGVGELCVTKYINKYIPIDQYFFGDLARFQTKPCPCGEKTTFELLGRKGHDHLKIVGAVLQREEFDRVVSHSPFPIADYRAEAREILMNGELKGKIMLRLLPAGRLDEPSLHIVEEYFSRALRLTPTRTLQDLVVAGHFLPLEVETVLQPFPQKHKDIKLLYLRQ